jgi:DNA-binding PadR family transcriptional regulator
MISDWFQRVGSSVPRGFSRYFILKVLKNKPHTGKEIIDLAVKQSDGIWKPSPGLIYPLLGRLLDEGLIEETKTGKYQITRKGKATSNDLESINDIVKKQLDVLFRIGNVGRFVAIDVIERIASMGSVLSSNVSNMTKEETSKYKKFLESELRKIEKESSKKKGKQIKID